MHSAFDSVIMSSEQETKTLAREAFAKWLRNVFGQAPQVGLGTYTFRDLAIGSKRKGLQGLTTPPGRQFVTRAAQTLVSSLMESGITCFVCVEVGSDTRRLHLHSLESSTAEEWRHSRIHSWWREKYGHVKFDNVRSEEGVSLYVTKYVTKSDMPFWAGGKLFLTFREPIDLVGDRPM